MGIITIFLNNVSLLCLLQWQSLLLCTQILRFNLEQVGIFNKKNVLPGTRKDGRGELHSLVFVPSMSGLNLKSLQSACDVKAVIRTSDGDVKSGSPIDAF